MVAVDIGNGQPIAIGAIDEKNMPAVMDWLKDLKLRQSQALRDGIGAIITDDLAMYRGIAEKLELGHQVCQFHVRRWVGRTLSDLEDQVAEEWLWVIERKSSLRTCHWMGIGNYWQCTKHYPGNVNGIRSGLPSISCAIYSFD